MKILQVLLLALILVTLVLLLVLPNGSRQRIRDAATSDIQLSNEQGDLVAKEHMTERDWDRFHQISAVRHHR